VHNQRVRGAGAALGYNALAFEEPPVADDDAANQSPSGPTSIGVAKREPRANFVPAGDPVPLGKGSHVYLIDGSGYIFRAFHALPPLTRPSDGLPVGAVHGFCQMLWKLVQDSRGSKGPTHLAVIFDAGKDSFRNEIYAGYKAQRPPPPEELVPQFPLIREAVKAFNIPSIEMVGFEADDIIATYAVEARAKGATVTIVSSDKDLMQLVGGGVGMLDTMKNREIGPDEVFEKFGVKPDKVIEVQALAGDSVDNVPGVPGIGIKTAAELINQYGDLETLLEKASEIKQPKRREKLIEFAEQARISKRLVALKTDVALPVPQEAFGVQDTEPASLLQFLRVMEFNSLTKKIAENLGAEAPPPLAQSVGSTVRAAAPATAKATEGAALDGAPRVGAEAATKALAGLPVSVKAYETVTTLAALETWIAGAREVGRIAIDTETTSLDAMQASLVGISLALAPGRACYIPIGHTAGGNDLFGTSGLVPGQLPVRDVLAVLKPLLEDRSVLKIGHNIKYDALLLQRYGVHFDNVDDTMLLSYALDGGRSHHGMDTLAERHLRHTPIAFTTVIETAPGAKKSEKTFAGVPIENATQYAAEDADVTLRLWLLLKPRLAAVRLTAVYETLERPLLPIVVEMERHGITVDKSILARLSSTFAQKVVQLEEEVFVLAGQKFNLGSPKQLGELLFDTLKLPGGKKTKTGQWETKASLLDDLAGNEDLPDDARKLVNTMVEWRQLTKLRSTYTDALPEFIHPETGRIHTSYTLAATTTGRFASSDPNLQNIPVRTKEGREIRTAFIAAKGHKLVSADYSQIELRVLAHIANIPQLKAAFAEGLDIHAMTASEMFGVPIKDMPSDVRRRAKAINFGIIYGISGFGLAAQLGISKQEAGEYIKTYFKRFPGIRAYMDAMKAFVKDHGYVETIFGRRIHYPEAATKNPSMRAFIERAAINAPIQGSAADIIRRAMVRMPPALRDANLAHTRMLLQVHDELIFEAKDADVAKVIVLVKRVMEQSALPAVHLSVPIQVDAKAAANWDEAH
jgi:DNA polymerase I